MTDTFEITDVKQQDARMVRFAGLEKATGAEVEIFRYIGKPISKEGLKGDSAHLRPIYEESSAYFCSLRHPHLRSILASGVDNVDAMPWAVMELLPGIPLNEATVLGETDVRLLAAQAMAVLDAVGPEGKAALSLQIDEILYARADTGLAFFSFRLWPFQSLTGDMEEDAVQKIGELVQLAACWPEGNIPPSAFGGLGQWTQRALAGGWDEAEARESLQELLAAPSAEQMISAPEHKPEPVKPVQAAQPKLNLEKTPKTPAATPVSKQKSPEVKVESNGNGLVVALSLILLAAAAGAAWWYFTQKEDSVPPSVATNTPRIDAPIVEPEPVIEPDFPSEEPIAENPPTIDVTPTELPPSPTDEVLEEPEPILNEDKAIMALFPDHPFVRRGAVEVMRAPGPKMSEDVHSWKSMILTGRVYNTGGKKKFHYISFGPQKPKGVPYVRVNMEEISDPDGTLISRLKALAGKEIAVIGTMKRTFSKTFPRYYIELRDMNDLKELP